MPRINPAIALLNARLAEGEEELRLCKQRCADLERSIGTLRALRDEAAQAVKKRKKTVAAPTQEEQP